MRTNLTDLRANLYRKIDELIATGVPIEIERDGHLIKIVLDDRPSKIARLKKRTDILNGSPDDLIHDSPAKWEPDDDLS